MTRFEPRTSVIRSDRFTNWATTTTTWVSILPDLPRTLNINQKKCFRCRNIKLCAKIVKRQQQRKREWCPIVHFTSFAAFGLENFSSRRWTTVAAPWWINLRNSPLTAETKNVYCQLYWKDENVEKEAGNGPLQNLTFMYWVAYRRGRYCCSFLVWPESFASFCKFI